MDDLDDAHAQFDLHPEAWRFDPGYPPSMDHRRRWLAYRIQEFQVHGFGCRAIELQASGRLIGACGLDLALYTGTPYSSPVVELYYRLGFDYWGKGYATEAVTETLRHAFEDLRVERVLAHAARDNTASINLLKRVGFHVTDIEHSNGEIRAELRSPLHQ